LNGCVPVDFLAAESVGKGGAMASRWIGVNMPVLGKKYLVESWSLSGKNDSSNIFMKSLLASEKKAKVSKLYI